MRELIIRHTDGRVCLVTAIFETGFKYAIYPDDASIDRSEAPTSEVQVESVRPTLIDAYTDTIAALGAGWTFYRDGVVTVLDQNVVRVVPEEVPGWAFRAEIETRGLTAAVNTAITSANGFAVYMREHFKTSHVIRRDGRLVKHLITSAVLTPAVANQIFRSAARTLIKH